jgi:hypothetical protein
VFSRANPASAFQVSQTRLSPGPEQDSSPLQPGREENSSLPGGVLLQSPAHPGQRYGFAKSNNAEPHQHELFVETPTHSPLVLGGRKRVDSVHGDTELEPRPRHHAHVLDSPARPSHSTRMRKVFADSRHENFTPTAYATSKTQRADKYAHFHQGSHRNGSSPVAPTWKTVGPLPAAVQLARNTPNSLNSGDPSPGSSGGVSLPYQTSSAQKAPRNRKRTELYPNDSQLFKSWRKAEAQQAPINPPWKAEKKFQAPHALLKKSSWRAGGEPRIQTQDELPSQPQILRYAKPIERPPQALELKLHNCHDAAIELPHPIRQLSRDSSPDDDLQSQKGVQLASPTQPVVQRERHMPTPCFYEQHSHLSPRRNYHRSQEASYHSPAINRPPSPVTYAPLAPLTQPPTIFVPNPIRPVLPTSSTWSGDSAFLINSPAIHFDRPHPPTYTAPSPLLSPCDSTCSTHQAIVHWLNSCDAPTIWNRPDDVRSQDVNVPVWIEHGSAVRGLAEVQTGECAHERSDVGLPIHLKYSPPVKPELSLRERRLGRGKVGDLGRGRLYGLGQTLDVKTPKSLSSADPTSVARSKNPPSPSPSPFYLDQVLSRVTSCRSRSPFQTPAFLLPFLARAQREDYEGGDGDDERSY